jgi:hypothetical protein
MTRRPYMPRAQKVTRASHNLTAPGKKWSESPTERLGPLRAGGVETQTVIIYDPGVDPGGGTPPAGGGGTLPPVPPGPSVWDPSMRPLQFADINAAKAGLSLPSDANYVTWSWGESSLEVGLATLGANDILVLPEKATPYWVDSSKGFTAASSSYVSIDGAPPLQRGRGWFSMTRARRGIVGLGPDVVIEIGASSFSQGRQPDRPRYIHLTNGGVTEQVGAAESIIDFDNGTAMYYMGNFVMRGRDLGGVAYNAIKVPNAPCTLERIFFDGAHRGFSSVPNGETAAFCTNGALAVIRNVEVDCRNSGGTSVGSSPVMFNRTGQTVVEDCYFHDANYGMPTFWECFGTHTWNRVRMERNGSGINFEDNGRTKSGDTVGFVFHGEQIRIADPKVGKIMNLASKYCSQQIQMLHSEIVGGSYPGSVYIVKYNTAVQVKSDVLITNASNVPYPLVWNN